MALYGILALLLLSITHITAASPLPEGTEQNFTLNIPAGLNATQHNSSDIFCVIPSPWFSGVGIFYLGNYAAHAATLVTYPGEPPLYVFLAILYALFFPTSGITRGLNAIFRFARIRRRRDGDLCIAARSGALCMVVRSKKWRPKHIEAEYEHIRDENWRVIEGTWAKEMPKWWPFFDTSLERPSPHHPGKKSDIHQKNWKHFWLDDWSLSMVKTERKIHGTIILPDNGFYELAYVPRNAVVKGYDHVYKNNSCQEAAEQENLLAAGDDNGQTSARNHTDGHILNGVNGTNGVLEEKLPENENADDVNEKSIPTTLSSSYSVVKTVIAIIQILYATFTLYKAIKGPQIKEYGYAAFGLTVVPYLLMSLVNVLGNICTPSYDSLYIVHSSILAEAKMDYPNDTRIDGAVGEIVEDDETMALIRVDEFMLGRAMQLTLVPQGPQRRSAENYSATNDPTIASTDSTGAPGASQPHEDEIQATTSGLAGITSVAASTHASPDNAKPRHSKSEPVKSRSASEAPSMIRSEKRHSKTYPPDGLKIKNTPKRTDTDQSTSAFKMIEKTLDTRRSVNQKPVIHTFPENSPQPHFAVAFTCPKIERTDKENIPPTHVLRENRRRRNYYDWAYFDPRNRAECRIPWYSYLIWTAAAVFVGSLSLIFYGLLSQFKHGQSTHWQRVWTMTWLASGLAIGTFAGFWSTALEYKSPKGNGLPPFIKWPLRLLPFGFAAFSILGFLFVGKMLRNYGNCVTLY